MIKLNVKNYMYRWFDTMLIVRTENNEVLYLYCSSGCIHTDGDTTFYCYDTNMGINNILDIEYVEYSHNCNSCIQRDCIVEFIKFHSFGESRKSGNMYHHTCHNIQNDILSKAGGYWHYENNDDVLKKDRIQHRWSDAAAALSDMFKQQIV